MYPYSHLEDKIRNLLYQCGIQRPSQLRKEFIAERLQIHLYYFDGSSEALIISGHPYIFLNQHIHQQQQWQDFAHELGHLLLHAGHQQKLPPSFRKMQEWQADLFMYHLCIPTFMLQAISLPPHPQETIAFLAETFNVTYAFAYKRLERYLNKLQMHGIPQPITSTSY